MRACSEGVSGYEDAEAGVHAGGSARECHASSACHPARPPACWDCDCEPHARAAACRCESLLAGDLDPGEPSLSATDAKSCCESVGTREAAPVGMRGHDGR